MCTLISIVHKLTHTRTVIIVWPLKENLLQLSALRLDINT